MKNQKVILKFDAVCERDNYRLRRIEGTVTPDSIIKLVDIADLEANPREAKVSNVTDEIMDSLSMRDGLFQFKSKGILVAAGECKALERKRYELKFSDEDFEGVLDGGHNILAIALYILRRALGDEQSDLKRVKRWEDLKPIWTERRSDIADIQDELDFFVPLEVIYPHPGKEGQDTFEGAILDIAQARNNNAELTLETKANKAGYYDEIRSSIDPDLVGEVEWKTNDGGRIKVRDLVALAWIPLYVLPDDLPGKTEFNPVHIYSSKGACTKAFNDLIESEKVSSKIKGDVREITHAGVKSAIALMRDLPELYDYIYERFPEAYNTVSPGFGRIEAVRLYQEGKNADAKYLRSKPHTKFYRKECKFDYPDGYVMPIIFALSELINVRAGKLEWKVDPKDFIDEHLNEVLESYVSTIQMAKYDPQTVGKSRGNYNLAVSAFRFLLK